MNLNVCSWTTTRKRLICILSWINILYIQSIQNQSLPWQEAYRIALKPSKSCWNTVSTGSRCQRLPECNLVIIEIFLWQIFPADYFFSLFVPPPPLPFPYSYSLVLFFHTNGRILPLEQSYSKGCLHSHLELYLFYLSLLPISVGCSLFLSSGFLLLSFINLFYWPEKKT